MGETDEKLIAKVRQAMSCLRMETTVLRLGTKDLFSQSQSWEGYNEACESWHHAYWTWVDQETPAELVDKVKRVRINWPALPEPDWSLLPERIREKLPCSDDEKKTWFAEHERQRYLQNHADFRLGMRGPEAQDPQFYRSFVEQFAIADAIDDKSYFDEIANQKQRKPAEDKGDRRLKYQLLLCWIPACLWAFTTDGVAQFLNAQYPRSENKLYNDKTILDARRDLKLYRAPKPLWWGLKGTPLQLEPLR